MASSEDGFAKDKPPIDLVSTHSDTYEDNYYTSSSLQALPPPVEAGFLFFCTPKSCRFIASTEV
jgi:hypothetical protein